MTYIKIEDDHPQNPKVAVLSDGARLLYLDAICYCNRQMTDGFVPGAIIPALRVAGGKRAATELVAAGMFEPAPGGYQIHDYLKHQRSRVQIEAERTAAKARWQRFRNASANAVATGELQQSLDDTEVRGESGEVRGESDGLKPITTVPPVVPPVGGRAERAKNGSKRRRDVEALEATETAKERNERIYFGGWYGKALKEQYQKQIERTA